MYTYMYTLYVSQCLPPVLKMARWIGRVGGYQRPGNDKELRWSLWSSVWSGPLLMTIFDQDATISHLFTGFLRLLPQTRAGNMKFLVLKVNSKTSNSGKSRVSFSKSDKKHKLPRYCLHCCFVDVREPWLCLLGMVKRAPRTATVYQGKASRWWSPNWSHVKVESLSVAKGWGNPEVLWHFFFEFGMLQCCSFAKGCHLVDAGFGWFGRRFYLKRKVISQFQIVEWGLFLNVSNVMLFFFSGWFGLAVQTMALQQFFLQHLQLWPLACVNLWPVVVCKFWENPPLKKVTRSGRKQLALSTYSFLFMFIWISEPSITGLFECLW